MARATKHNSLTDKDQIEAINPENAQLLRDFLNYLQSTQRSESTILVYKNDLEIAFVWASKNIGNAPFVQWTKRNIIAFQNWLINENGNSSARVRRIKATLSSLSNFIEAVLDDEYPMFRSIVRKVESPPAAVTREKTVLSDAQFQTLLDYLVEKGQFKKACMVALAISSGRRKAELCRFKVEYFNEENLICDGALYKTSEKIKTKGRGKGKYLYCFTLAKKFKPYFDLWMKQRQELGIKSVWLFPDEKDPNKQMSVTTMNSWAESFGKILNVDWYFHCVRHAFTTGLVRAGIPDSVIQDLVGWESADMCRLYTDIDAEERFSDYFKGGEICPPEKKNLMSI